MATLTFTGRDRYTTLRGTTARRRRNWHRHHGGRAAPCRRSVRCRLGRAARSARSQRRRALVRRSPVSHDVDGPDADTEERTRIGQVLDAALPPTSADR